MISDEDFFKTNDWEWLYPEIKVEIISKTDDYGFHYDLFRYWVVGGYKFKSSLVPHPTCYETGNIRGTLQLKQHYKDLLTMVNI